MIIASIPYKNNKSFFSRVPYGADLVEFRLDYSKDIHGIEVKQFNSKQILSYRDTREGGKNGISDNDKLKLYQEILDKTDAILDCEHDFLMRNPHFIVPEQRLILSLHTDSADGKQIQSYFDTKVKARYYKLALKCNDLSQLDNVLNQVSPEMKAKLIFVPLSPVPLTIRLVFRLYGSHATYVYLKDKTALNQPSLTLANACRIDNITEKTELYGIIGSKAVVQSLSVFMHNYCFKKNKTDNALIPIIASTPEQALKIVNWLKSNANLKGLAITMPFKKKIPYLITGERIIANSWLVDSNTFINTDETAMDLALDALKLPKSSSVLIFGTGATSKIAQRVLEQKGYENYQILSRQQLNLKKETKKTSKVKDLIFYRKFDLLINCTPFGLKAEDKPKLLPEFDALIDLPYGIERTTLVNYAIKKDLPHVSGTTFWKWQAIEQAEFFGLNLRLEQRLI